MPLPPAAPAVAGQAAVLDQTQQLLEISPRLAFDKAALLRDPILRERMRRDAFLALSRLRPEDAAALLPSVIDARWLPSVHFAQALDIAWFTVRDKPDLSRRLLLASATRHPASALRESRQYIELPYGPAIRDAARAASAVPDADLLLLQVRQNPSLAASLPASEILRIAAAARTEDERETAIALLRQHRWQLPADTVHLRGSLALLGATGSPLTAPVEVIRAALTGIDDAEDPLAEAVKAAVILAAAPAEAASDLPASPLGRLLRAQRGAAAANASLPIADLFPDGLCLQRHIFHNDDDGIESFDSFLRAYANDPAWTLERTPDYVHLAGRGAHQRRIEIYANIPVDLQLPANAAIANSVRARQEAVTRALPGPPVVLVHRGHDHHFDVTRKFLKPDARLVYLGSCYGMTNVEDVVTRCRRAQLIATRGIGATAVNDAFLRDLNRQLLQNETAIEWDAFWSGLHGAIGSHEHFRAYVPPHRNEGALFLADFYRQALSAP